MFIELTSRFWNSALQTYVVGPKHLVNIQSGVSIVDNGDLPATWVNNEHGFNPTYNDTYVEIKEKLIKAGLLVE